MIVFFAIAQNKLILMFIFVMMRRNKALEVLFCGPEKGLFFKGMGSFGGMGGDI